MSGERLRKGGLSRPKIAVQADHGPRLRYACQPRGQRLLGSILKPGASAYDEAEQIVQPVRGQDLQPVPGIQACADCGRRLRPPAHRILRGTVRRIAVADMHARLIFNRPFIIPGLFDQPLFQQPFAFLRQISRIIENNVNIGMGRLVRKSVQPVPHRPPDVPGCDVALRKPKLPHPFQILH
ncbi:hypothetical protein BGX30_003606 [Mortierella sp. GBA39]|nr:hypothetical protein BGX30_003606 [Mortierella sp. GBA39]